MCAAAAALAQEPAKPPAVETPKEVDQALRARVSQFFQAHVDRKLSLAIEVVADESKDYFLEMDKPRYYGFQISSISYSDEFTRAQVVVNCDGEVVMMPRGKMRVNMPLTTRWKLVDGKWYWFAEPSNTRTTPFGAMQGGPGEKPPSGMPLVGSQSGLSPAPPPPKITGGVTADKTAVVLDAAKASSDAITLSNSMEGWVSVEVYPPDVAGLTMKAEKKDIPPGGSVRIVFEYQPLGTAPAASKAIVQVLPIGPVFQIKVGFRAPAAAGASTGAAPAPVEAKKPRAASKKTRP